MLLLRTLILTLFVSLPATASVMENEQSVFELSVNVKTLLLKYYHVQADEGNPQLVDELLSHRDSVLAEKNAVVAALPAQYSLEGSAVNEHWDEFDRLLNQNITEIRESNYPELQVVTLMREAQRSLLDDLSHFRKNADLQRDKPIRDGAVGASSEEPAARRGRALY